MSSFIQSIFGGSNQSSTQQATSTPTNLTSSDLQGLSGPLSGSLSSLLQQWGVTGPQYSGQTTAPVTQNESNILNSSTLTNPASGAQSYINDVLGGKYLPGSDGNGGTTNPFLNAAITAAQRPTLDNLTQVLSRTLPGTFTANGQMIQNNNSANNPGGSGGSSAFDRAAALAYQSAANASTDIAAKIGSQEYENERGLQNQAASLDQQQVQTTISALQAEALPRLIQQYGLDQGVSLFQSGITNLLQLLQTTGAVQKPTVAQTTQSTGSSDGTSSKGVFPDLFPKGI